MPHYKLTYFDVDGGRAEPIRIAFHVAGIEFEDVRLSFPEFMETRGNLRFHCVPVLEIDGIPVTQSNAMSRYVGRLAGLYPEKDLEALYCDEALGAIEDVLHHIVATLGLKDDELKIAREKLVEGWLTIYLKGLNEMLEQRGAYFADDRLTIADLKVFGLTQWLLSGDLEHIPPDLVGNVAPRLAEHAGRISADPVVSSYYRDRK
jgi:glutathione S-transferase